MLEELADTKCKLSGAWLPGCHEPVFPIGDGYSDTHQSEMYAAITEGDSTAVVNTNPTGGGKTLSWAAPVIRSQETGDPSAVLAAYPTRALIQDQQALLSRYVSRYFSSDKWAPEWSIESSGSGSEQLVHTSGASAPLNERVCTVTGADVTDASGTAAGFRAAEEAITDGDQVGLPTIVLTTPDALTLLATGRYSDRDLGALPSLVNIIVVDEFHLTSARGKRLLPFHLDTYLSLGQAPLEQLVFLSATPTTDYISRIERAFDAEHVTRDVRPEAPSTGRQILPEVEFGVTNRNLFSTGQWLADHSDLVERAVDPPGQTLVIVDSVREVDTLAALLAEQTSYDVGRVYGWRQTGRQTAIQQCDIVVGNTAVEVGVDFDRVNRLVFTAHSSGGAIQRLGRMRVQSDYNDYRALCITTPEVQDAIHQRAHDGRLSRSALERIFSEKLAGPEATRPYDALCATYVRYLWSEANPSLNEFYVPADTQSTYQNLVYTHFGPELEALYEREFDSGALWEKLGESQYLTRPNVMQELHTYRSSSLNCIVIDATDEAEPLKQYGLRHVLRYREGEVIPLQHIENKFRTVIGRGLSEEEQAYIEYARRYSECGVIVVGDLETPRDVGLHQLGWNPSKPKLTTAESLRITASPSIKGQEHLAPLATDVLVYYTPTSPDRVRAEYLLGPYANLLPYRGGSLCLWEDALLVHAAELADRVTG